MTRLTTICLTVALLLGSSGNGWSADYQKGFSAFTSGDYASALREWIPLAEQGHANAQYYLGMMLENIRSEIKPLQADHKLAKEECGNGDEDACGRSEDLQHGVRDFRKNMQRIKKSQALWAEAKIKEKPSAGLNENHISGRLNGEELQVLFSGGISGWVNFNNTKIIVQYRTDGTSSLTNESGSFQRAGRWWIKQDQWCTSRIHAEDKCSTVSIPGRPEAGVEWEARHALDFKAVSEAPIRLWLEKSSPFIKVAKLRSKYRAIAHAKAKAVEKKRRAAEAERQRLSKERSLAAAKAKRLAEEKRRAELARAEKDRRIYEEFAGKARQYLATV